MNDSFASVLAVASDDDVESNVDSDVDISLDSVSTVQQREKVGLC
jgi:hypothetical protein